MRTYFLSVTAGISLFLLSACSAPPPPAPPQPEFRPTSTLREVMESTVEPNADFLWNSVASVSDEKGTREQAPQTDEEWQETRNHAVTLLEATNTILVPGRRIAKPGEKAEDPANLSPEQIDALIKQDPQAFAMFAHGLYDATTEALKAIDAKNKDALLMSGEGIDKACENCHLKYWYPNDARPQ